jgi:YjbE family integral membrane protein
MDQLSSPAFWLAVGQIILIDILLGGDNAVVIALACRKLPAHLRTRGILWGAAGAIILRVVLVAFALALLAIPYLKLVGAVLLVWIGVKLLMPDTDDEHGNIHASDRLWGAIRTIIVADFVMSLDNVIAIAGAAETAGPGHAMPLVIFGLVVSIPIIIWGSQLVLRLMDRYPIVITLGAMLLGWIAGSMAVGDPALAGWMPANLAEPGAAPVVTRPAWLAPVAGAAGALLVLAIGKAMAARATRKTAPEV